MKWKDLGGEERYRVVEMVRKGEMTIKEICEAFGVTRQALRQAVEKADLASVEALEPRKRGRKPRKLQEWFHEQMKVFGFPVLVFDNPSREEARVALKQALYQYE